MPIYTGKQVIQTCSLLWGTHKPCRDTHRRSHRHLRSDSDCRQSEEICWQTNSSGSIRSSSRDSFISCRAALMFYAESYIVLHRSPFVFCLGCRRPSRVLTWLLRTVCLTIPCLSEMTRTGTDCRAVLLFFGESISWPISLAFWYENTPENRCKKLIKLCIYPF